MNDLPFFIDALTCKNCYHQKEDHRFGYLECSESQILHEWYQCRCKAFQPFNLGSNKITWYVDRDIPDNTVTVWNDDFAYHTYSR